MNGLLFITHQTDRFSYLQSALLALEGGCRQIQLRMKDHTPEEILKTAYQLKVLCDDYQSDLYIDDYPEIAREIQAKGVHLGKSDMHPAEARSLLGNSFVIGGTANTLEDIEYLHRKGVNYIGLGPFRFTTTKQLLSPVLGLEGYRNILAGCLQKGIHIPVVAIGGITIEDIPDMMRTGVSGIALSSTILQATDPVKETEKIINIINKYPYE